MPELPEVETTVRDLRPHVVGRRFAAVEIGVPRMVRFPSPEGLRDGLPGRQVQSVERRGKFIVFRLDRGALVVHLMMGGALLWVDPGATATARTGAASRGAAAGAPALVVVDEADEPPSTPQAPYPWIARDPAKYTRLHFHLDDGTEIWFVNPRTLGGVWLVDDPAQIVGHLGPEPLEDGFTAAVLASRLAGRSAPIKPLLLSQEVVAGIGNIYADESLFLAGIRPERPADELTAEEVTRLHAAILESLNKGVRLRGTSLGDFVTPEGTAGSHQDQLNVFRRHGHPCPACGSTVERKMFRGRGTHYCPHCQK